MGCRLGVVGLGHWFAWLKAGVNSDEGLDLRKAVGTRPFADKAELLASFGIDNASYYISDASGSIPEDFFNGIDMVHISDPNRFHMLQAMESLRHGKKVIVEKTLATDEGQFRSIVNHIRDNGLEGSVYLHLHYIHKQPSVRLASELKDIIAREGRIRSISAVFFEEASEEDMRRTWLLDMANGGIFMDWVHPYEVIYYSTRCRFGALSNIRNLIVNENYSREFPTGVESVVGLSGENFAEGATATIRVAKGVPAGKSARSIRMLFESGKVLGMEFPGHDKEFSSPERGSLGFAVSDGGQQMGQLTGSNTSELFVGDVINLCRDGSHGGLKIDDIEEIFRPQWEYQRVYKAIGIESGNEEVGRFISEGISNSPHV